MPTARSTRGAAATASMRPASGARTTANRPLPAVENPHAAKASCEEQFVYFMPSPLAAHTIATFRRPAVTSLPCLFARRMRTTTMMTMMRKRKRRRRKKEERRRGRAKAVRRTRMRARRWWTTTPSNLLCRRQGRARPQAVPIHKVRAREGQGAIGDGSTRWPGGRTAHPAIRRRLTGPINTARIGRSALRALLLPRLLPLPARSLRG